MSSLDTLDTSRVAGPSCIVYNKQSIMRDSVESKIFKLTYLKIKYGWLGDMCQF